MKNPRLKSTLRAEAPAFVPNKTKFVSDTNAADIHLPMNFKDRKLLSNNHKQTRFRSPHLGKIMVPKKPKKEEPAGTLKELLKQQSEGKTGLSSWIARICNDRAFVLLKEGESEGSDHYVTLARKQLESVGKEAEKARETMRLLAIDFLDPKELNSVVSNPCQQPAKMSYRDAFTKNLTASSLASQTMTTDPIVQSSNITTKTQQFACGKFNRKEHAIEL
jgi:hypothetical protein